MFPVSDHHTSTHRCLYPFSPLYVSSMNTDQVVIYKWLVFKDPKYKIIFCMAGSFQFEKPCDSSGHNFVMITFS